MGVHRVVPGVSDKETSWAHYWGCPLCEHTIAYLAHNSNKATSWKGRAKYELESAVRVHVGFNDDAYT